MTRQVTLDLPDELYEQARSWATLSQQELSGALTDAISLALMPLPVHLPAHPSVADLKDGELLALAKVQMESSQGAQMDELLRQQSAGTISRESQRKLAVMMQVYHQLWLRQSAALAEAVRRGLLPPMQA